MRRKTRVWLLFVASLIVLSLGATPYGRNVEALDKAVLRPIRFLFFAFLSALALRDWWKHHQDPLNPGTTWLRRWRRWYTDEHDDRST